jgi:hypothetical protein
MAVVDCKCGHPVGLPTQTQREHPGEDCTVRCPCGVTYELTLDRGIVALGTCSDPGWHERKAAEDEARRAKSHEDAAALTERRRKDGQCVHCGATLPAAPAEAGKV